jgi:hypothetical protein
MIRKFPKDCPGLLSPRKGGTLAATSGYTSDTGASLHTVGRTLLIEAFQKWRLSVQIVEMVASREGFDKPTQKNSQTDGGANPKDSERC